MSAEKKSSPSKEAILNLLKNKGCLDCFRYVRYKDQDICACLVDGYTINEYELCPLEMTCSQFMLGQDHKWKIGKGKERPWTVRGSIRGTLEHQTSEWYK